MMSMFIFIYLNFPHIYAFIKYVYGYGYVPNIYRHLQQQSSHHSILATPTNNVRALHKKQFYLEYGIFIDISKV